MIKIFKIDKKESSFWKSVVILSTGHIFAIVLNFISYPLLSRIYNSTIYGEYGIITSIATIIMGFSGLSLGPTIMSAQNEEESLNNFQIIIFVQAIISGICILVMAVFSPIHKFFNTSLSYYNALVYIFFYMFFFTFSACLTMYANKYGMDKALFLNPIIGSIALIAVAAPLGLLFKGPIGLFLGNIMVYIARIIHMLIFIRPFRGKFKIRNVIKLIRENKKLVLFQTPAYSITALTSQLPTQMLFNYYGAAEVGHYSMTERILGIPSSLLAGPISNVYFRTISKIGISKSEIADFTFSLVIKILAISFLPFIILSLTSIKIIPFILGSNWILAAKMISILCLQYIFMFCSTCTTYCRIVIRKNKVNTVMSILNIVMIVISLIFGNHYFHGILGAIFLYSVFNVIFNIINLFITFWCLGKWSLKFLIISFPYSIVFFAILFFTNYKK
jgi:O-antigen/teichoic acid export membrane protein